MSNSDNRLIFEAYMAELQNPRIRQILIDALDALTTNYMEGNGGSEEEAFQMICDALKQGNDKEMLISMIRNDESVTPDELKQAVDGFYTGVYIITAADLPK